MNTTLLRGLAFAGAIFGAALPAVAPAQQAAPQTNYIAHFSSVYGSQYPYEGTLQLRIGQDGIVTGYYRPADNFEFIPVTGGRDGDRIWFDIGQGARATTHVDAKLHNGTMTGSAIDENQALLNFTAASE